jgi:hypothetical protein
MAKQSRARAPTRAQHATKKPRATKPVTKPATKPAAKRGPPKMQFTPELLEECRYRFERTPDSIESIGLFCGVSARKIDYLAQENKWTRFHPEPLDVPQEARLRQRAAVLAEQSRANALSADDIAAGIADVLAGVRNVLANVRAMQMRTADEQTPLDVQRLAQTYARLNGTLRDLQHAQQGPQSQHYAGQDYDDFPADIDAFRDALAQRIENFVASRRDEELLEESTAAGAAAL